MNHRNKKWLYLLLLTVKSIHIVYCADSVARVEARKVRKAQLALQLANTFNPLMNPKYDEAARVALITESRKYGSLIERLLSKYLADKVCSLSLDLRLGRLDAFMCEATIAEPDLYDLYTVAWMRLKPEFWHELERNHGKVGLTWVLANKMQHPTLHYMRKYDPTYGQEK